MWVMNKTWITGGSFDEQFDRAASTLVNLHADDPEVARLAQFLSSIKMLSRGRDAFLKGIYANARHRETKGLATLALATYLELKAVGAEGARRMVDRPKIRSEAFNEAGELVEKEFDISNEMNGYQQHLRMLDPDAIRAEAERLYGVVIDEYGDIPFISMKQRKLEALLRKAPPEQADDLEAKERLLEGRRALERLRADARTLADIASERLDATHNLAVGRPAPEIDGVDFDGNPLRLSDYRGKVVALVFWGSWCGPCLREIPRERALLERLKGRPFALLGVDCDEDRETARKVMGREGITWPNWHDGAPGSGPIARRYHVEGYPTAIVIDAEGKIRFRGSAGVPLDDLVERLVGETEKAVGE